jgi:hypothetical protein
MRQANLVLSVKNSKRKAWDNERTDVTGTHLFRIEMLHLYTGDIEGEGSVQYLIADNGNGKGSFVALEKVTGSIGGRSGSFVFQHTGTFDNGRVREALIVLAGSGTGSLIDLSGEANIEGDVHQESYPILFSYEI